MEHMDEATGEHQSAHSGYPNLTVNDILKDLPFEIISSASQENAEESKENDSDSHCCPTIKEMMEQLESSHMGQEICARADG